MTHHSRCDQLLNLKEIPSVNLLVKSMAEADENYGGKESCKGDSLN